MGVAGKKIAYVETVLSQIIDWNETKHNTLDSLWTIILISQDVNSNNAENNSIITNT